MNLFIRSNANLRSIEINSQMKKTLSFNDHMEAVDFNTIYGHII